MNITSSDELSKYFDTIFAVMKEDKDDFPMSETAFGTWFEGLTLLKIDENKIVFGTQDDIKRRILVTKYYSFIEKSIEKALGFLPEVEIICSFKQNTDEINGFKPGTEKNEIEPTPVDVVTDETALGLFKEYTFDNYVVGSSNKMAHAFSQNVANDPNGQHGFNPLFIYGPSGLGKSHLMHAIGNYVHDNFPTKRIICKKSEDFLNEMVDCLTRKDMQSFHEKYRNVDLLLLDDIQFISGKKGTQEEFFHTFDVLMQHNGQIVLTSDRPPKEIPQLVDRLQSRFEQGIIVDIQPPEYELRIAIIKKKSQKGNIDVPNDVLAFLAEKLHTNIREIEGAVKKIGAYSLLHGEPITLDMVKSCIPEYIKDTRLPKETVDSILAATAHKYNVTVSEILGKARTKEIKTARNVSMYIIKQILDLSLPNIGKMMNRDHSTVHSNISAIETEMETNPKLAEDIHDIIAEVKNTN